MHLAAEELMKRHARDPRRQVQRGADHGALGERKALAGGRRQLLVELPLKVQGMDKTQRDQLVDEALAAVGLDHVPRSYPWQLSGGMQQRVAIARAVAYQPEVLLMDEPFAAVDAQTRADLEDLVRRVWRQLGITVLFVTHDIAEAIALGDRTLVLSRAPARIAGERMITIPRPRDIRGIMTHPDFGRLYQAIRAQVQ